MSSELEIEFKNLVTKEEILRMMSEFNIQPDEMIEQQNYYFDTQQFDIKKISCALRIRKKKQKYELTLKQPVKDGNLETNEILSEQSALKMINTGSLPDGEVKSKLDMLKIHISNIYCFGSLTTKRTEIVFLDDLLVFDISSYLNKVDYEIEYEVKDKKSGEQRFQDLMDRFQIPIRTTENKIMRFYREYKKINE